MHVNIVSDTNSSNDVKSQLRHFISVWISNLISMTYQHKRVVLIHNVIPLGPNISFNVDIFPIVLPLEMYKLMLLLFPLLFVTASSVCEYNSSWVRHNHFSHWGLESFILKPSLCHVYSNANKVRLHSQVISLHCSKLFSSFKFKGLWD